MTEKEKKSDDESFDEIINWGSPLSRTSDSINSTPQSSTLDFLDDDDDIPILKKYEPKESSFDNKKTSNDLKSENTIFDKKAEVPIKKSIFQSSESESDISIEDFSKSRNQEQTILEDGVNKSESIESSASINHSQEQTILENEISTDSHQFSKDANITDKLNPDIEISSKSEVNLENDSKETETSIYEEATSSMPYFNLSIENKPTNKINELISSESNGFEILNSENQETFSTVFTADNTIVTDQLNTNSEIETDKYVENSLEPDFMKEDNNLEIYDSESNTMKEEIKYPLNNTMKEEIKYPLNRCKSTKLQSEFTHIFFGDTLVVVSKKIIKRCFNNQMIDKLINNTEFYSIKIPEINENAIKNKLILDSISLNIRNIKTDYPKIKALLNLSDEKILKHDLKIKIDRDVFNSNLAPFNTAETIFRSITNFDELSSLEKNLIKYNIGMEYEFHEVNFSKNFLEQIALLNDQQLIREFILSQDTPIIFIIIFYKLGLIDIEKYKSMLSGNIFYQFALSKLGLCSFKNKSVKNRWNVQSLVDFGISKILNVENEAAKTPLENVLSDSDVINDKKDDDSHYNTEKQELSVVCKNKDDLSQINTNDNKIENSLYSENEQVSNDKTVSLNPLRKSLFEDSDDDLVFEDKLPVNETGNKVESENNLAQTSPFIPKETFYKNPNESIESLRESEINEDLESKIDKPEILSESQTPQLYNKKFSKSFADIFTLEGNQSVSENVDVSSYVSDPGEKDKPILFDDTESKSSVISSLFGLFKKKTPDVSKSQDDLMTNRATRPLKAEIKAPEKKERKVIHSTYANKKDISDFEIPGFKQVKK